MTKKKETYSYKGWLISDSFIKRSFAILGYAMVAHLLIMLILFAVGLVIGIIGMMFGV